MRHWSDATSLDTDASPSAELGHELERSRRYERAFSLVRVRLQTVNTSSNGGGPGLIEQLKSQTRAIDRVWELDGDLIYLLPECDGKQAQGFVRRLEHKLDEPLSTRVASFPDDGLTSGSLMKLLLDEAPRARQKPGSNGNVAPSYESNGATSAADKSSDRTAVGLADKAAS